MVQLQDVLDEVVDFVVFELEILEEMARDTQEVEGIDGFSAGRRRRFTGGLAIVCQ